MTAILKSKCHLTTADGDSSTGGNGGTDGGESGARGESDGEEDFDFDELDEEMPDFLVGEDVEKID